MRVVDVRVVSVSLTTGVIIVYCLVHLKYYMHLLKNFNFIKEIIILEHIVQGTLPS